MKTGHLLGRRALFLSAGSIVASLLAASSAMGQQSVIPGDLLVSYTEYQGTTSTVTVGQALPGGGTAVADGSNLGVFANATPDSSFGITSEILIDQFNTTTNTVDNTINVTAEAAAQGINLTTSFPSKSELALNTSTDGTAITFMGYSAPINTLDVSNSNTPGLIDSTNPVTTAYSRSVAQINLNGSLSVTPTNAYSGNNGRAAILVGGNYVMVGNAGNGSATGAGVTALSNNTGVQAIAAGSSNPNTTVIGVPQGTAGSSTGYQNGFSITQTGAAADKSGKDDNFRGETIFNDTLYVTKGSGSNGVDTVYQVGATGSANSLAANAATTPIAILPGFNTVGAKTNGTAANPGPNPFGLFFANAGTLYVADEGNNTSGSKSVADSWAGLEKWVNSKADGTGTWSLAYTLTNGLKIGQSYTVSGTTLGGGTGSATTQTAGLRNLAGVVNSDGTVTLYAITSTSSGSVGSNLGDAGADPNELVAITDTLGDTTAASAAGESFTTLETAVYGEALRGVDLTPIPEPSAYAAILGVAALGFVAVRRRRQTA